jgi:L-lactate dehydrogenase complex protein LldF
VKTRVEEYARGLDQGTTNSVRSASAAKVKARLETLPLVFDSPDDARSQAAAVKSFVLDNLRELLLKFEGNCVKNGIQIHWAKDAESANRQIIEICNEEGSCCAIENRKSKIENSQERTSPPDPLPSDTSRRGGGASPKTIIVKAKSMASEEIHLNKHLQEAGFEVVETDLGEFVVQIDNDTPSHIVTPIIHKSLKQVARSFDREHLGPYTEVAEELTLQARVHLREKFKNADIGISGVNFGIASSGRLVLLENEGNNRLSTTAPRVHIAIMGLEKIVPSEVDLATFIPLLAGSATGQKITTYVHFIAGPSGSEGPEEVHLILLDNGRSRILGSPYKDILRCIRCGACLNVCPVYRQASGHGYGHVYSGPLGAVLAPALEGVHSMGDLAKASTLCGACEEVCPVKIPIPHMLLMLRDEDFRKGVAKDGIPWGAYDFGAQRPFLWRAGLSMLPMAEAMPSKLKSEWKEFRDLPERKGRSFRGWWRGRS